MYTKGRFFFSGFGLLGFNGSGFGNSRGFPFGAIGFSSFSSAAFFFFENSFCMNPTLPRGFFISGGDGDGVCLCAVRGSGVFVRFTAAAFVFVHKTGDGDAGTAGGELILSDEKSIILSDAIEFCDDADTKEALDESEQIEGVRDSLIAGNGERLDLVVGSGVSARTGILLGFSATGIGFLETVCDGILSGAELYRKIGNRLGGLVWRVKGSVAGWSPLVYCLGRLFDLIWSLSAAGCGYLTFRVVIG